MPTADCSFLAAACFNSTLCRSNRVSQGLNKSSTMRVLAAITLHAYVYSLHMQTYRHTDIHADKQTCRQTDTNTGRQEGRQAGRQAGTQTDTYTGVHIHVNMHVHITLHTHLHGHIRCSCRASSCQRPGGHSPDSRGMPAGTTGQSGQAHAGRCHHKFIPAKK